MDPLFVNWVAENIVNRVNNYKRQISQDTKTIKKIKKLMLKYVYRPDYIESYITNYSWVKNHSKFKYITFDEMYMKIDDRLFEYESYQSQETNDMYMAIINKMAEYKHIYTNLEDIIDILRASFKWYAMELDGIEVVYCSFCDDVEVFETFDGGDPGCEVKSARCFDCRTPACETCKDIYMQQQSGAYAYYEYRCKSCPISPLC